MRRVIALIICIVTCVIIPAYAMAAENEPEKKGASHVSITVVVPQQSEPVQEPPEPKPVSYLYPVSVWEANDNGRREVIKIYELSEDENPERISREPFERDGYRYELADITKEETASCSTREHTETSSIPTESNDVEDVVKLLAPAIEYQSEDGYIGVLSLDISSVRVETAGTKRSSYTVNATREYPHLSSNDSSLVPKTITENGRTLTLSDVTWQTQASETVDYYQIPTSYTAVASYSTTASKTSVTGYTTTAEYRGTITKIATGKMLYTAYFLGVPIVTPEVPKEVSKEVPKEEPEHKGIFNSKPKEVHSRGGVVSRLELSNEKPDILEIAETADNVVHSTEPSPDMQVAITPEPIVESERQSGSFLAFMSFLSALLGFSGCFALSKYLNWKKEGRKNEYTNEPGQITDEITP